MGCVLEEMKVEKAGCWCLSPIGHGEIGRERAGEIHWDLQLYHYQD